MSALDALVDEDVEVLELLEVSRDELLAGLVELEVAWEQEALLAGLLDELLGHLRAVRGSSESVRARA